MTLQPQTAKLLSEALLQAYTYNSLEIMLFYELGKKLGHIAPMGNLEEVIFNVISTAEMQGWTSDLVHAAHDANPGNVKLKKFANNFLSFTGSSQTLERIIQKTNSFLDVASWRAKLERLEYQVCCVEINGSAVGTGFLIAHDMVMTNYHVIESLLKEPPDHTPQDVKVRFDFKKDESGAVLDPGVRYALDPDAWLFDSSPYSPAEGLGNFDGVPKGNELDYAILRIAAQKNGDSDAVTPGYEPIIGSRAKVRGWIVFPQRTAKFPAGSPLFIIQHPKGTALKMALSTDSVIGLNSNQTRLRHKTSTEPGSSGSACFDSSWNLVALHHAGDPSWQKPSWNQAIPLTTILEHLKANGKLPLIANTSTVTNPTATSADAVISVEDEVDQLLQS